MKNLERFKEDLERLIYEGFQMILDLHSELPIEDQAEEYKQIEKDSKIHFNSNYETWYSEASSVIKQIIPDRLEDFKDLYRRSTRDYL